MEGFCINLTSPDDSPKALIYDVVVGLANILFIAFLSWHLRRCLHTLKQHKSTIMSTYYGFVWAVCGLNLFRTIVQIFDTPSAMTWNMMWLLMRFCTIMLEISVVVFLLHGYIASSSTALLRSVAISAALAFADLLVKAVYIAHFHIPLYSFGGDAATNDASGDMTWAKWGFWFAHSLLFTIVYALLMLLPLTQWRDLLPAKDTFHRYVRVLFATNLVSAVGALLIALHLGWGYCLYGFANVFYYALYPPLLYVTFLASFFKTDDIELDNYYYSEMSEAGYVNMDDNDIFLLP